MDERSKGDEFFLEKVAELLCVQQIPGRVQVFEDFSGMIGNHLRMSGPINSGTSMRDVHEIMVEDPLVARTTLDRRTRVVERERSLLVRGIKGIPMRASSGRLINGALFYHMVVAIAAGCWKVVSETLCDLALVFAAMRADETPAERLETERQLVHLTHWAITEAVVSGQKRARDTLAFYLQTSHWVPGSIGTNKATIDVELLLCLCCSQAEYLSVMPDVVDYLVNSVKWKADFPRESLLRIAGITKSRIVYLRESHNECLVDKKIRMNQQILNVVYCKLLSI